MAKRPEGKKFETLVYHDRESRVKIDVPVQMVKGGSNRWNSTDRDASWEFLVDMPLFEIHERDKDINALRDRVFAKIALKRSTTWEDFLHVFAGGRFPNGYDGDIQFTKEDCTHVGVKAAITLIVSPVRVGTRHDGSKVHQEERWQHTSEGMPSVGPGEGPWDGSSSKIVGNYSLIPDTPENRRALAQIVVAMENVDKMLKHVTKQDSIEANLVRILENPQLLALPAARPAIEAPKKKGRKK